MSTHCGIGILRQNGEVNSIYCHFDGYPEHTGKILRQYYEHEDTINKLINLGELSYLDKYLEPSSSIKHTFDSPQSEVTVAYHRDRGEDLKIDTFKSKKDFLENGFNRYLADYLYLYQDGKWEVIYR